LESNHSPAPARRLILASASARRIHLLDSARYGFEVEPAHVDEENYPPTTMPIDLAMHLARAKADVVSTKYPDDVILAADTVVAFGDWIIGKPRDPAHARSIIELLSGTTHIVITGVSVVCIGSDFAQHARVMSLVRMKSLSTAELDRYIASNLWEGKAGGYGLQDPEAIVKCAWGDPTNVIGLPMIKTKQMLTDAGVRQYDS
jgi:septum formation protein